MAEDYCCPAPPADSDLAWLNEAVQGVSRTFALTVDTLEEPMATYISAGYLVCRIADTVEDAGHVPPAERVRLLRLYDAALDRGSDTTIRQFRDEAMEWSPPDGDDSDDWTVVEESPRVHRTFETLPEDVRTAITPPVSELVTGLATFVEGSADAGGIRIGTRSELERYCYYAAGTVGIMITNLLTIDAESSPASRRLYRSSVSFGLLLQAVNVAKDVYVDYVDENNVYLPADWLSNHGVPQEDVLSSRHSSGTRAVVRRLARYAHDLLPDAQEYLETMPLTNGNTVAAWAIPYLLAVGTLRELRARPRDALSPRGVKVDREEVYAVVSAVTRDPTIETVRDLRSAMEHEPAHVALPGL